MRRLTTPFKAHGNASALQRTLVKVNLSRPLSHCLNIIGRKPALVRMFIFVRSTLMPSLKSYLENGCDYLRGNWILLSSEASVYLAFGGHWSLLRVELV